MGFCYGKEVKNRDSPIELIEPSEGDVIDLHVTEKNDFLARKWLKLLTEYAKQFTSFGVIWTVEFRTIHIRFVDTFIAEYEREEWRNR